METGSCHCGAVRFTVEGSPDKAIECNCSHCSRKGYLLWFVPRHSLSIQSGEAALSSYLFNKHVIRHQFCKVCGCAPFGLGTSSDGTETAAINVRLLEGIEIDELQRVPFNGRDR